MNILFGIFKRISSYSVADGRIDFDEFCTALGTTHCLFSRRLFDRFNVTKSAAMNFREFVMALSVLSTEASEAEKVRFAFDLFDMNRDDTIDTLELKQLLTAALSNTCDSISLSPAEIDDICDKTLRQMDIDGNGVIEFKEYEAMVRANPHLLSAFTIDLHPLFERYRPQRAADQTEPHDVGPASLGAGGADGAGSSSNVGVGVGAGVGVGVGVGAGSAGPVGCGSMAREEGAGAAAGGPSAPHAGGLRKEPRRRAPLFGGCGGLKPKKIEARVVDDLDSVI